MHISSVYCEPIPWTNCNRVLLGLLAHDFVHELIMSGNYVYVHMVAQHTAVRPIGVSHGRPQLWALAKSETPKTDRCKILQNQFRRQGLGLCKNHNNQLQRDAPKTRNITLSCAFFLRFRFAHSSNGESHKGQWWFKKRVLGALSALWDTLMISIRKSRKPQNAKI